MNEFWSLSSLLSFLHPPPTLSLSNSLSLSRGNCILSIRLRVRLAAPLIHSPAISVMNNHRHHLHLTLPVLCPSAASTPSVAVSPVLPLCPDTVSAYQQHVSPLSCTHWINTTPRSKGYPISPHAPSRFRCLNSKWIIFLLTNVNNRTYCNVLETEVVNVNEPGESAKQREKVFAP